MDQTGLRNPTGQIHEGFGLWTQDRIELTAGWPLARGSGTPQAAFVITWQLNAACVAQASRSTQAGQSGAPAGAGRCGV